MSYDARSISRALLDWYRRHGREFPFRKESDPYALLVAEVMLRKTTARQVSKIWPKFIARFPDFTSLSKASVKEVERLLAPLGIRRRAQDLIAIAKAVGKRPGKALRYPEKLTQLPGVGEYIANCIGVFCYGKRLPLVDSNVRRVLSRLLGLSFTQLKGAELAEAIKESYLRLAPRKNVRRFHYAVLDLAALICRPKEPMCDSCPLTTFCAYSQHRV